MYIVKESFEWMTPEFEVNEDAGKDTIRIRGIALRRNVVSRNNRQYIEKEVERGARTWTNKPVTVNHDMNRKIGHVIYSEYNKGALEYIADIKKQPYVQMLRDGSSKIRGVSIEATYLHNQCSRCGDRFYTEEDFSNHMNDKHFIKTDPTKEVHGIIGTALSLVLSPEEPGYSGTTIELMEMYEKPVLRLLETVIRTEKERRKEMKKQLRGKATISPQQSITIDSVKKLAEQEEAPSPPCPEGWHEVEGKCVKDEPVAEQEETPSPPCPDGWHEVDGACVKDVAEQEDHGCKDNEHWDAEQGKCVLNATEQEDHGCADDEHWDGEKCVKNEVAEQEDHGCAEDEHWNEEKQSCVKNVAEQVISSEPVELTGEAPTLEPKCPEGFHREGEACVVDEAPATAVELPVAPAPVIPAVTPPAVAPIPPETKATSEAVKLPALLRLGEPFANYTDFADCVAKNPDKEDAEAFCASIKQKVEGEPVKETAPNTANLYTGVNQLSEDLSKKHRLGIKRDVLIAETVNRLNRATAQNVKNTISMKNAINAQSTLARAQAQKTFEHLGKLDEQTSKRINEVTQKNKVFQESTDKLLGNLATGQAKNSATYITKPAFERSMTELHRVHITKSTLEKSLAEMYRIVERNAKATAATKNGFEASIREIKSLATEQKTDFEKILSVADKNAKELQEHVRSLEEWKKAKEQEEEDKPEACPAGEHRNEAGECVKDEPTPEAEETTKKLQETVVRLDNLEAKLKGQFKGQSPKLKETAAKDHPEDPLKKTKRRRN